MTGTIPILRYVHGLCARWIGTDFKLKDADHGEGGRIYDPRGRTYKSATTSFGNT